MGEICGKSLRPDTMDVGCDTLDAAAPSSAMGTSSSSRFPGMVSVMVLSTPTRAWRNEIGQWLSCFASWMLTCVRDCTKDRHSEKLHM